jgi:hypothetical protein
MRHRRFQVFIVTLCSAAWMQAEASAQTVQLPSFSRFSYSGSVLVPTGGSTSLGGVSRSSAGRSSRGLRGRALGAGIDHAGARAHVTIIDHDAIDRQIRGLPAKGGPASGAPPTGVSRSGSLLNSRVASQDPDAEGKALVRFARKQFLAGHRTSAFDAYRMAIETLSPTLSRLAMREFQRVFPAKQRPLGSQPGTVTEARREASSDAR